MKKKFVVLLLIISLMLSSVPVFAAAGSEDPQMTIENQTNTDTGVSAAIATAENASDVIPKITVKSIKAKLADRFVELNKLRAECKSLWAQIKTLNDARKAGWAKIKGKLKAMKPTDRKNLATEIKNKLQPLRNQVQKFHTEIMVLRAIKEAEWVKFRAAIKAKNLVEATSAINAIINLKSQIVEKQKAVIPVMASIVEILKQYAQ